ncbi:MAG: HAD family phosphatase [Eubacterium sp.]|nr:HAD family phosphatase [Eubacterium sp.]
MKIAAIDLDGTLLRSDCTISDYSKKVIEAASEHGILVVPTSGRSHRSIMAQIKNLSGIPYTISANGSVITDCRDEKILYERRIDQDTAYEIYRYITDRGGFYDGYSGNDSYIEYGADDIMYATKISDDLCRDLLSTDIRLPSLDERIRSGKMAIDKVFFSFIDPDDIAACVEWLGQFDNITYGYSTTYTVEIFPKGSNKDVAFDHLRKELNISKKDTIGIGDSENDLSLVRYAHLGAAVANGMEILRKHADYICPSNDEDGPAKLLEEIMNKKQMP